MLLSSRGISFLPSPPGFLSAAAPSGNKWIESVPTICYNVPSTGSLWIPVFCYPADRTGGRRSFPFYIHFEFSELQCLFRQFPFYKFSIEEEMRHIDQWS